MSRSGALVGRDSNTRAYATSFTAAPQMRLMPAPEVHARKDSFEDMMDDDTFKAAEPLSMPADNHTLLIALTRRNAIAKVNSQSVALKWQAANLKLRRGLKAYFNREFDSLIAYSATRHTQSGFSTAPVIHVTNNLDQPFLFIEKATQYKEQRLGLDGKEYPFALVPEALAREKSASDLVEKGLTPHFCLVYKTVVERSKDGFLTFTRYTEFGGEKTVAQCLMEDETYRTSLAFELHAKIQVATAFAVALAHTRAPFYQGDLHANNVVVQPLTDGSEGVAIENPFCLTYKSRFLFRIIDFVSPLSSFNYGKQYNLQNTTLLVFEMLFKKRRFALADILAFFIHFDIICKTDSILTHLAFMYVYENMENKQEDVAEGIARMLLTFYDDPPRAETLYGARSRRRSSRRRTSRMKRTKPC